MVDLFRQVFWLIPPSQHLPTPTSMQWLIVRILRELQQRVLSPIYTAFPHWLNLFLVPKPDTKISDNLISRLPFNIKFRETFLSCWYRNFSVLENFFLNLTREVFSFCLFLFSKPDMIRCVFLYLGCKGAKLFSYVPYKNKKYLLCLILPLLFLHHIRWTARSQSLRWLPSLVPPKKSQCNENEYQG